MSNAYSIIHRQQPYTQALNVGDIEKTMAVKQNNFDYNMSQVNQAISQFSSIDLARDEDKLHLYQNMKKVLDIVGDSDNIDFSKTGVGSELSSYISMAIDGEVIKQAGNTQKLRKFNAGLEERRQKGEISEKNYQYALIKAGYSEYMAGKSNDLGNLTYYEYSDVDLEQLEYAKKLKEVYKDREVEVMDPTTGRTIKKSISALTEPEMADMLRKSLNEKQLKQLEINGSFMFNHDPQKAQAAIREKADDYKEKVNKQIDFLKGQRDMAAEGSEARASIDSSIKKAEEGIKKYVENMYDMKTPEQIGGYMLREQMVGANASALTKEFLLSDKYDASWVKMLKEADEKARLNNGYGMGDISTITASTVLGDEIDVVKKTKDAIAKTRSTHDTLMQNKFNELPDNQKELVRQTMEAIKNSDEIKKEFPNGISNETLQRMTIEKLGYKLFDPKTREELLSSINRVDEINKQELKLVDDYLETNVLNQEMFEQTFDQESQMVVLSPDGSKTTMGELLRKNGVRDYDSYRSFIQSNSADAKLFKGSIALQSMSLSEDMERDMHNVAIIPAIVRGAKTFFKKGDTSLMHLEEYELGVFKKSMELMTGENLEDVYEIKKVSDRVGGENIELRLKNPNSKFAKIAQATQEASIVGGGVAYTGRPSSMFVPDQTIRNESSLKKLFSEQAYNDAYEKALGQSYATLPGNQVIRIQGSEKKDGLNPAYIDVLKHLSNTDINWKKPIDLYKNEDGSITVYQTIKERTRTNSKGEIVPDQSSAIATISANDIRKMPYFLKQVEMDSSEKDIETMASLRREVKDISFVENTTGVPSEYQRKNVKGLQELYDGSTDPTKEKFFMNLSVVDRAEKMLFPTEVNALLAKSPEGGAIKDLFKDMTTNTDNYQISLSDSFNGDYNITISNKDKVIGSIPISSQVPTDLFKKVYNGTPQVFLSLLIDKQIREYREKLQYAAR